MALPARIGKHLPVCALALCSSFALAQTAAQPTATAPGTEMTLTAVATSRDVPYGGLHASDFTLLDNKVPTPITSFRELDSAKEPVDVILVVDTVNTDYDQLVNEREQIDKFLLAGSGRLAHYTSLVIFKNTDTQMQENFTSSGAALSAMLDKNTNSLRTMRPGALAGNVERLQLSLALLTEIAKHQADRPGRKSVIWVSPGWPLLADPEMVLNAAQQEQLFRNIVNLSSQLRTAGITLYNINPVGVADSGIRSFYYADYLSGISKPGQTNPGNLSLQVLATQSGGLVLISNDVTALLRQCVNDADHLYEFSFHAPPGRHPDEYHHLQLKASVPGLVIRTRDGYYAQPGH